MSDWVDIGSYFKLTGGNFPFGEPEMGGEIGGFDTTDITFSALQWECDPAIWPSGNTISSIKVIVTSRDSGTSQDWIWEFYGGESVGSFSREFEAVDSTSDLEFVLDLGGQCDPTVTGLGDYALFWMHDASAGSYGSIFVVTSVEAQGEGSLFGPSIEPIIWTSHVGTREVMR